MINSAKPIRIEGRSVGFEHPPFLVAEISANHGGNLERALNIIDRAASAGADGVKFQSYTADSLTLDLDSPAFSIDGGTPWSGQRLYDLYQAAATPYEWFPTLFAHCRDRGLVPFASPFDQDAIDMLETLACPAYKIASFEAVDHGLIASCAKTGKPLIISVGLCTFEEIDEAVKVARQNGAREIILLQCNSAYPSPEEDANLLTIPHLSSQFDVLVGYSDHTLTATSAVAACALGACVIEKHFIDDRGQETADSHFSITPAEFELLARECRTASKMRGSVRNGPTPSEKETLAFRRSLYATRDIRKGESFTSQNVKSIRPGHGLPPKHLPEVLNKSAARNISTGEALTWSMIRGR